VGLRIALIGCGLIGRKRTEILPTGSLVAACDIERERAEALAGPYGADATTDWRTTVSRPDVDAVIVATTHDQLAPIATAAARAGKHVLIEKPGALRASDLDELSSADARGGVVVRVGFNHRYHRAMQKVRELVDAGAIGRPQYARGRYGHGGRIGYDREWRADPELSGGGEAIDQGIHLIDLSRWYLGEFTSVYGATETYFWDMPVEDNVFMLLRGEGGTVAHLHASWTEWKNLFSFELTGRLGKLEIAGLGGSYGIEQLTYYRMLPEMGPPETTTWQYPMADDSWKRETESWLSDITTGKSSGSGVHDAQEALRIIERIYAENGR
jgi:predicted dehydrogenase